MGRYYLASLVGAGTRIDPFRPLVDGPFNILDLRGDPSVADGFCLLWVPDGVTPKGRTVDLGDDPSGSLPSRVRRRLGNDLKVDLATASLGEVAAEMLLTHATPETDKTRPNPLNFRNRTRVDPRDGVPARYRAIYLGPPGARIWEQYYKGGPGASLSDDWVGLADSDSPDGNNHTWTEANLDWDVVNEEIVAQASGSAELRNDSNLSSANHRSKSTIGTQAGAANTWLDATVRFASGARTYYAFAHQLEQGGRELYKRVAGSYTSITSDTGGVTLSAGDVLECEVDGSDLEGFLNGGAALLTATDTSVTGNTQAGLSGFATGAQRIAFSGWEAADLGAGTTPINKDLELDWAVLDAAGDAAELDWAVLDAVGDTVELDWPVATPVGTPVELDWSVGAVAGDEVEADWSVRAAVGDASNLVWSVAAVVGDESEFDWLVTALAGDEADLRWSTLNTTGDTVELDWPVSTAIGDTTDLVWGVAISIGDTLNLQWPVRSVVGDVVEFDWAALAVIGDAIQLDWDVIAVGTVGDIVALAWGVRDAAGDTIELDWPVRERVNGKSELDWSVLETISDESGFQWVVSALSGDEINLLWGVGGTAGGQIELIWDVLFGVAIGDTVTLIWGVRQATGSAIALVWDTASTILITEIKQARSFRDEGRTSGTKARTYNDLSRS